MRPDDEAAPIARFGPECAGLLACPIRSPMTANTLGRLPGAVGAYSVLAP